MIFKRVGDSSKCCREKLINPVETDPDPDEAYDGHKGVRTRPAKQTVVEMHGPGGGEK